MMQTTGKTVKVIGSRLHPSHEKNFDRRAQAMEKISPVENSFW